MRTGVLVHGCHLDTFDWRGIVWGHPDTQRLGRVPRAAQVAIQSDAELLVFGTGASVRTVVVDGVEQVKTEGEFTHDHFLTHLEELSEFEAFRDADLAALRPWFESISEVDSVSRNTPEEVRNAAERFVERGIERMILVSSPTHISRCLRDACSILDEEPFRSLRGQVYATPSESAYLGSSAENVVIFEPPHRADRHSHPLHANVERILRIPETDVDRFLRRLDGILQEEFRV